MAPIQIAQWNHSADLSGRTRYVYIYPTSNHPSQALSKGTPSLVVPRKLSSLIHYVHLTEIVLYRDGPGAFDFIQGDNSSDPQNPFWEIVKGRHVLQRQLATMFTGCQVP